MAEKDIATSLKRMHRFEVAAAEIYKRQMEASACKAIKKEISDAYQNETNHVEGLKRKIKEKGGKPSLSSYLFSIGGFLLGLNSSLLGLKNTIKMNISLEQKAVKDYEKSLETIPFDTGTKNLLEKMLNEEKKHIDIWQECLNKLSKRKAFFV